MPRWFSEGGLWRRQALYLEGMSAVSKGRRGSKQVVASALSEKRSNLLWLQLHLAHSPPLQGGEARIILPVYGNVQLLEGLTTSYRSVASRNSCWNPTSQQPIVIVWCIDAKNYPKGKPFQHQEVVLLNSKSLFVSRIPASKLPNFGKKQRPESLRKKPSDGFDYI